MDLFRKVCIILARSRGKDSTITDFSVDSRFKAHTVMEDETWIFVRAVLAADVHFSNAIMSDINGGLQPAQRVDYVISKNYGTYPILAGR